MGLYTNVLENQVIIIIKEEILSLRSLVNSFFFLSFFQVPTISIPNWYSILAGVPPEMSGYFTNDGIDVLAYDNIFRNLGSNKLKATLIGFDWYYKIFQGDLQPFAGKKKKKKKKKLISN